MTSNKSQSRRWLRLKDHVNSTPTSTARAELHSMITFHHANTRGSRAGRLRVAHLCVPKQFSSTCCVSFLAAPDSDHKPKFSSTYFTYLYYSLTNTHKIVGTRSMFTGRVADQHKSHLSQVTSPNRLRSKPSRPKRSNLETLEPEELRLTGILGQIRIKYNKHL